MTIGADELKQEEIYLDDVIKIIRSRLSKMGQDLYSKEEKQMEFVKYAWDNRHDMDPTEMKSVMASQEFEVDMLMREAAYFRKLFKIQNNPYFGSIIFEDEDNNKYNIYIGITYVNKDDDTQVVYDWRSPICSLFYDFEEGKCSYTTKNSIIKGELKRKRQYKIEDGKLIHVFDNSINIDDELLQEVLSTSSSDKMKNIVNTIQQEQNRVIRNTSDHILIVQGIAGSGKTSVALHRIAFLLYKIDDLNSNNVLIFSPNKIFSEYISNVLPELGEDNTIQTTFRDYLTSTIKEYKDVESFSSFIARFYTNLEFNKELVRYKQSDEIIEDINKYVDEYIKTNYFTDDLSLLGVFYTKEELNDILKNKYSNLVFHDKIDKMAEKISENNFNGSSGKKPRFKSLLLKSLKNPLDYRKIYSEFYKSKYSKFILSDREIKELQISKTINYEDATLFVYVKSLLEGFPYNNSIKQVVIDEAQDYTRLQFLIISKIFKKSDFTILGDVNQTINPYYKYDSLFDIEDLFQKQVNCLSLEKTYRSSSEIIEYTNKILGLTHSVAIRKPNSKPVLFRKENENLDKMLVDDLNYLNKSYKSVAIITKTTVDAKKLHDILKDKINITLIDREISDFNRELVIIPSYIAKGLEFDAVIVYSNKQDKFINDKYLYYVACTRSQHELIIYNE